MERFSRFEKNLLQGLYRYDLVWGSAGDFRFRYNQLRWIQSRRWWQSVREWPIDRMLRATSMYKTKIDDRPLGELLENMKLRQSLRVLTERQLIRPTTLDEPFFILELTGAGIALARRCDTWYGRAGIYYEERRESVLGLIVTVAVAAITSFITTLFTA